MQRPKATPAVCPRVAVVEDDSEMRAFIEHVLADSGLLQCSGTYGRAEEALADMIAVCPDVVLIDVRLPGISGIQCARTLRRLFPRLAIIAISGVRDSITIEDASDAGCDAYLAKPFLIHQLFATVQFSLLHRRKKLEDFSAAESEKSAYAGLFTAREREVIAHLANGDLYKEIAAKMGISFSLVHKVQNRLFQKLKARNRTEAVKIWQRVEL
jgi:DNA-binding NarL/FixJ family response regulator